MTATESTTARTTLTHNQIWAITLNGSSAVMAAVLVMAPLGAAIGFYQDGFVAGGVTTLGAGVGFVFALLFGRKLAGLDTIGEGAIITGLIPIGLMLLHAIRSGRITEIRAKDFQEPMFWYVFGGAFVAGAILGGTLVAVKQIIVMLRTPSPEHEEVDMA